MKQPSILHIADDQKFINAAKYLFDRAFPGANKFIIIKPPADPPLMYVKPWPGLEVEVRSNNTIETLLQRCKTADIVVLHGIDKLKATLLLESREKEKYLGIIFGAELYNLEMSGSDYLGEKTEKLKQRLDEPTLIDYVKKFYNTVRYINYKDKFKNTDIKEAFSALHVFGSYSRDSHKKWVERGIMNPDHQIVPFSYYPLEFIIHDFSLRAEGPNILLGNSASITNNHLEAFDILKDFNLNGRRIITPLSYGDSRYAKIIIREGKKEFAERFEPVTEFLSLQNYNKLMSRCGVVMMNHYRSQGMGNLIAALFLGAKVFMNDNSAYHYFKQIGCHIFLIEDLEKGKHDFENLDKYKIKHNRTILRNNFSEEVLVPKLREGLEVQFLKENIGSGPI